MIPVSDARAQLLDLVTPMPVETVPLMEAHGRVLAEPLSARRDQPPFAASAMDGYAVKSAEAEHHAQFKVIGEAAAGQRFDGTVRAGQAVRIFTGAPMPDGTDVVVIQEDTDRQGDLMVITDAPGTNSNVRPAGGDFRVGEQITAPRRLRPQDIALLAAMNIAEVPVYCAPSVAIISTGNELVLPGETPGPDQIVASNSFGLRAMIDGAGGRARLLPIARDTLSSLRMAFELAQGADMVVTIGGASVGDHDLVADAAAEAGLERAFYKVAMRPGKPLMAGRMGDVAMVGLPGNPVSAMVCGHLFILPMLRKMLGLDPALPERTARLTTDLPANGPREHYMRAHVSDGEIRAFSRQDSALLTVLSEANALLIHPPGAPARAAGETVRYLPL